MSEYNKSDADFSTIINLEDELLFQSYYDLCTGELSTAEYYECRYRIKDMFEKSRKGELDDK